MSKLIFRGLLNKVAHLACRVTVSQGPQFLASNEFELNDDKRWDDSLEEKSEKLKGDII